jgi:hypothetical protein
MKDHRLQVFRVAIDGLVESLDAVIRLSRWNDPEPKPEPLVTAAAKLLDRLGTADRLSKTNFRGSPAEVTKVTAMCAVLSRLDAAYLGYRKQMESVKNGTESASDAAAALETEIAGATSGSAVWR